MDGTVTDQDQCSRRNDIGYIEFTHVVRRICDADITSGDLPLIRRRLYSFCYAICYDSCLGRAKSHGVSSVPRTVRRPSRTLNVIRYLADIVITYCRLVYPIPRYAFPHGHCVPQPTSIHMTMSFRVVCWHCAKNKSVTVFTALKHVLSARLSALCSSQYSI